MKSELRASQRNCACKSLEHLLLFSVQFVLFFLLSLFLERGGGGLLIFILFVCLFCVWFGCWTDLFLAAT